MALYSPIHWDVDKHKTESLSQLQYSNFNPVYNGIFLHSVSVIAFSIYSM